MTVAADAPRMRPGVKIGLSGSTFRNVDEYERALEAAGAVWERLRNDVGGLDAALERVDGVLMSGGVDVEPARYGASDDEHAPLDGYQPDRDDFEIALALAVRARGVPTLAICRGLQVANVAYGGTLVTDIPAAFGAKALAHTKYVSGSQVRGLIEEHIVTLEPGQLADIVGTRSLRTNSRHHQSLDRIASGFRVTGRTPDGIVEAVAADFPTPFFLGVQWHPETTAPTDTPSRAIFRAFVDAGRAYAASER